MVHHRNLSAFNLGALTVLCLCMPCLAQESREPFKRLDRNQAGKLTRDEFSGPLFQQIHEDQDGVISAEEDQAFVRRSPGVRDKPFRLPESMQAELDIPNAATNNPRQTLDLYLPTARQHEHPLPVVVFIHGGAGQGGDKRSGRAMVASLVGSGE
jgi:acetyl esterase/lipase